MSSTYNEATLFSSTFFNDTTLTITTGDYYWVTFFFYRSIDFRLFMTRLKGNLKKVNKFFFFSLLVSFLTKFLTLLRLISYKFKGQSLLCLSYLKFLPQPLFYKGSLQTTTDSYIGKQCHLWLSEEQSTCFHSRHSNLIFFFSNSFLAYIVWVYSRRQIVGLALLPLL